MKTIPIVCYLFTVFDEDESLINFKKNYLNYKSGYAHDLIISYKLLNKTKIKNLNEKLRDIDYQEFIDPVHKNDFDFGTYKRVSEKFMDRDILFLNSHSYPTCDDWLKKLMKYKEENTLIGTSASNESLYSSIKIKKKYKFFSYLLKKYRFKKKFLSFPNPHLRTSSFLIRGKYLFNYIKNKKIDNKEDAWEIESGLNGLTNYFKNNNLNFYLVNSDGEKYNEKNWKYSQTYNFLNQNKSIISDKHTRKYLLLNSKNQKIAQKKTWGL
tara:strand:- start:438 stop:1241 length:804 start_codon:yes stop_codon:yes gene_type:complete